MTRITRIPLPVHARTGLTAIGLRRDGRPIWPVMGGDGTTNPPAPAPAPPAPPADPPADPAAADLLGEPGKKALAEERAARRAAEAKVAAYEKAEKDKADADKSDLQKAADARTAAEERATQAEQRALRLEVAHDKGLTPAQAKRLVGATKEELEADADDILANFPAKPAGPTPPAKPKPDPGQGARPGDKTASTTSGKSLYEQRHPKRPTT
jgi:hypothetical protein